jgi:hypothetical protein
VSEQNITYHLTVPVLTLAASSLIINDDDWRTPKVAGAKAEADPSVAKIAKRAETRMVIFILGDWI